VTTAAPTSQQATLPIVRSLVARASRDGQQISGVLGIRARPVWAGPTEFTYSDFQVRVAPCASALAVREALRGRADGLWVVVLTDRDESDLGVGITSRLHGGMLRNPDPWDAVRDQFGANRIDRRLVIHPHARDLAAGILAARGDTAWPPARAGFLTLDHVCTVVANRRLGFAEVSETVAPEEVLAWAADSGRALLLNELRDLSGEPLTTTVVNWLAARCGKAEPIVAYLLNAGRVEDVVPLGLAGRAVLACLPGSEPWVLLRIQQLSLPEVTPEQLSALVMPAEGIIRALISRPDDPAARQTGRVLARADVLVDQLHASSGSDTSELLRASLTSRLAALGEELRRAAARSATRALATSPDAPLVDADALGAIETALGRVQAHALAGHRDERRVDRALAAVRLTRWLASDVSTTSGGFASAMHRQRDLDAWVDRAYSDAWRGVDEPLLSHGLRAVLDAVRLRRDKHDIEFAAALAMFTITATALPDDVLLIEDLLARVVVPLAREPRSVLLIVADGMSASVATEIVDDIERGFDTWLECLPIGRSRRNVVVAALPSLTNVSRCSLLSGTLATGQQDAERASFAAFMKAHGLTSVLFHKVSLETSGAGFALAPDVGVAVDNIDGIRVVACVLNTIDDALDRSDPGIDWTTDTVAHLQPLLERARRAGRTVVLTADHGHVIERREGRTLSVGPTSSNRSRPASSGPALEAGEVRTTGSRVLLHGGDAILAVDERLRYGPLKAGYHGGAAGAEVVVPLHVLAPGEPPVNWSLARPQAPIWWHSAGPADARQAPVEPSLPQVLPKKNQPTLFDAIAPEPAADLAAQVLASATYADQRKRAQRVTLTDEKIRSLLRYAIAAPGNRLDPTTAAIALDVALVHLSGALPMAQRLLNVEQYPVLDRDPDGVTIVLDVALLKEQFGIRA
jgi:PglZ domain